ncbi:MAG: hypothetical protein ABIJ81_00225 [Patescibacteria group bacterium]
MGVKHFIKPTTSKIVLTLILLFPVYFIFSSLGSGMQVDCAVGNWSENCGYHPPIIGIELGFGSSATLAVIFSYLLSCTIISIINFKKRTDINLSPKIILIIVNSITILITLYKIAYFVSQVGKDLLVWWIPSGAVFSYIHFWQFVTFFIVPLPFGLYFIALTLYLLASILLIFKIRKETYNMKQIILSLILLLGAYGSFVIFIGE